MNSRTAKSILVMGLSAVVGYIINMFLTSYITEGIGIEAYGFVSIARTFVSYGSVITIALTSFVVRYITLNFHTGKINEAKSYYVSSVNASIILSGALALVFFVIVAKLEVIINIPDELIHAVKILFLLMFGAFVSNTISTSFSIGFYIKNRLDISGLIKCASYIVEAVTLVALFHVFAPFLGFVGVGSLFAALTILICSIIVNIKLVPELRYDRKLYSRQKVKILLKNGIWNAINQLGNILNSGLDLLVSNALLTGVQTGQIAVAKSIGAIFSTLSGIIFQPLQPELLKVYSDGITEKFLDQLKKSMKICGLFGSMAFAGFYAIGLEFYKLWMPTQNSNLLHMLTVLTVFTYIMDIFLQPIYYVNTLTVKNKIPCFITILGGLINVIGMYYLIKYTSLGIYSVPITTAIIMFAINFFFNPVYASWCLGITKLYFYPLVLKHLVATGALCLVFKGCSLILNAKSWISLIISAILMVIVGTVLYCLIMFNRSERNNFLDTVKGKTIMLTNRNNMI